MKKINIITTFALLSIILLTSCSSKKDPVQILTDANKAAMKVSSAQFDIVINSKMKDQTQSSKSKIFAKRIPNEKHFPIYFRMEEPNISIITYDGKQLILTNLEDKSVLVSDSIDYASETANQLSKNFNMIIAPKLDTAEIHSLAKSLQYVGIKTIDGEKCYELKQSASGHSSTYKMETHYYYSKNTSLLKSYHSIIKNNKDEVVQEIDMIFSNLKLNTAIPQEIFTQQIDPTFTFVDLDLQAEPTGMDTENIDTEANSDSKDENTATIPNGHKAPVWTLKDKDGNVYSLDNLRGKVVVMDFWATWCSPCKRVMPEIQKLWDKYKNQNVVIVGINTWEKNGDPVKFMKDNNYNYILLLNGNDVATKYNVSAIPTLYVIDKNGNVAFSEVGAVEGLGENLDRVISNLIKK
ncbi:MAG TPA: redoxin domain-containing protein [Bacteroidota bacterium]|nr:redoxin domain-containing protein [Bacteroidota bacterium]